MIIKYIRQLKILPIALFINPSFYIDTPVLAQACPYVNYAVINGNCVNLNGITQFSQQKTNPTQTQIETYQEINYYSDTDTTHTQNTKTCSEFYYQDEAQDYMVKYRANELDSNNDGIACEYLPFRKYGFLTKLDWELLKEENLRRNDSRTFGHDNPLTLTEVQDMLGFSGKHTSGSGRTLSWIWINIDNHKQYIEANFVDGKMTNLKGTFR